MFAIIGQFDSRVRKEIREETTGGDIQRRPGSESNQQCCNYTVCTLDHKPVGTLLYLDISSGSDEKHVNAGVTMIN